MIQKEFAKRAIEKVRSNPDVAGLAAGGSWITNEMDDYSDLDMVLVSQTRFSGDKNKMISFASGLGNLLNAFTGEHVGEPRLLICMYDNPFLHDRTPNTEYRIPNTRDGMNYRSSGFRYRD